MVSLMLKRYIIISLVLHIAVLTPLFFVRDQRIPEGIRSPLIARLITPEGMSLPHVKQEKREGDSTDIQDTTVSRQELKVPVKSRSEKEEKKIQPGKEKESSPLKREGFPPEKKEEKGGEPVLSERKSLEEENLHAQRRGEEKRDTEETADLPPEGPFQDTLPGKRGIEGSSSEKEPHLLTKLFDREIIERHSTLPKKKPALPEREETKKDGITFQAKNLKYYGFMRRLKERIESAWIYPPYEAERGIYGDLYVNFTIKKNGDLGEVEIVRTSGHRSLDIAALNALKKAAPFWPLPESWGVDSFTIKGHFVYTFYGTSIY